MTPARLDPARLPDADGHFGRFGGRFVPETLMAPLIELERAFRAALARPRASAAELAELLCELRRPADAAVLRRAADAARAAARAST